MQIYHAKHPPHPNHHWQSCHYTPDGMWSAIKIKNKVNKEEIRERKKAKLPPNSVACVLQPYAPCPKLSRSPYFYQTKTLSAPFTKPK